MRCGTIPGGTVRFVASTDGGATYAPVGAQLPDADWAFGGVQQRQLVLNGATEVYVGVEFDNPDVGGGQVWFNEVVVFED
jgi:hypothetical protein